jgi:carbon storage regulator
VLVLQRRKRESLLIGDNIVVTVVSVANGVVRLGIEAPAQVKVLREEVALRSSSGPGQEGASRHR